MKKKKLPGSTEELERYKDGWEMIHTKNARRKQQIDKTTFVRSVLGKSVPSHIASQLFTAFDKFNRGFLTYQDFICAIVVLSKGTKEERIKLVSMIYEHGNNKEITKEEMLALLKEDLCEKLPTHQIEDKVNELFKKYDTRNTGKLTSYGISKWINEKEEKTILLDWANDKRTFSPNMCIDIKEKRKKNQNQENYYNKKLQNEFRSSNLRSVNDIETFTNLTKSEVTKLDELYKKLISEHGKIDKTIFSKIFPTPLPNKLLDSLFRFFDEDMNGYLDSREFIVGFSYLGRPSTDKEFSQCKLIHLCLK